MNVVSVTERRSPVVIEVVTDEGGWKSRSVFHLDEASGLVMAESAWGTYSYYWPPAYRDSNLFAFLASLDFDYFMGKAARQPWRELDEERTFAHHQRAIVDERRSGDLTRERARILWEALTRFVAGGYAGSSAEFLNLWHQSPELAEWRYGPDVVTVERDTAEARQFWHGPWLGLLGSAPFRQRRAATAHHRRAA
jgi:hypothetical protein